MRNVFRIAFVYREIYELVLRVPRRCFGKKKAPSPNMARSLIRYKVSPVSSLHGREGVSYGNDCLAQGSTSLTLQLHLGLPQLAPR